MFKWFRALSAKEIWAMLSMLTLQEETKAYQSIFAEGAAKRKVIALRRLFKRRFAALPGRSSPSTPCPMCEQMPGSIRSSIQPVSRGR